MFRLIGLVVFIAAIFGGGFYAGVRYHKHEIIQNPDEFYQKYRQEFSDTMKARIDGVKEDAKKDLREKLE